MKTDQRITITSKNPLNRTDIKKQFTIQLAYEKKPVVSQLITTIIIGAVLACAIYIFTK